MTIEILRRLCGEFARTHGQVATLELLTTTTGKDNLRAVALDAPDTIPAALAAFRAVLGISR